jgi:hypothetical protein
VTKDYFCRLIESVVTDVDGSEFWMDATTSALETPPMSPFDIVVLRA